MPASPLSLIDDVDTRREMLILLQKLDPAARVAWLYWCMDATNDGIMLRHSPPWVLVTITNATGDPMETFLDFCMMVSGHGMDPKRGLVELEKRGARAG